MCQSNWKCFVLVISVLTVNAMPWDELMEEKGDDTAVVESTVREARAIPEEIDDLLKPGVKNAFLHTYGDKQGEEGNLLGYSKKMNDKGNDGYQHRDGFHKKDSDKYGYEFHTEFGQENKAALEVGNKNEKENKKEDIEEADDAEETKKSYEVVENVDDNKKYKSAIEDFDFGYFGDSGEDKESAAYTDGSDGGDKESESYSEESSSEENIPHPVQSEKYSSGDSGSYSHSSDSDDDEDGNTKSSSYAEAEDDEDY